MSCLVDGAILARWSSRFSIISPSSTSGRGRRPVSRASSGPAESSEKGSPSSYSPAEAREFAARITASASADSAGQGSGKPGRVRFSSIPGSGKTGSTGGSVSMGKGERSQAGTNLSGAAAIGSTGSRGSISALFFLDLRADSQKGPPGFAIPGQSRSNAFPGFP
jgi:hypothetical protein